MVIMMVHGFVDQTQVKREKAKAKDLRRSQWWKQKIATGLCAYCGLRFKPSELTMDHKIPLSRGGRSSKGNCVPCCKDCNNQKKYFTPAELILQNPD